ncbi:MAG: T9SS type A sorting domain-containing protein, partial [Tangfeifania sp.]
NKYELKLNNIPKGIYFLRVRTTEDKVVAKKLIVSER